MKKAAILIADEYQDLEVWYPYYRLKEAGWTVQLAGTQAKKEYRGKFGYPANVDTSVEELHAESLDCLVIPGGWAPDIIRRNSTAVDLVKTMFSENKTIAAICHGGWVLVSAGILKGRKCTSFSAIRTEMMNAGGAWEDSEVVIDQNLITSRKPEDMPSFCKAILATDT